MQPLDLWVVPTNGARHASPKARAFIAFVEEQPPGVRIVVA